MKRIIFLALAVPVFFAGCPRQAAPDYFPLVKGARKHMRILQRRMGATDTTETTMVKLVSIVREERDLPEVGKVWIVESPRDSGRPSYSYFRKTPDAVLQVIPREGKPAAELAFLELPLAVGKEWFDTDAQRQKFQVVAKETVAVEAGTYPDCFKVAVLGQGVDWAMHQWFAPGVGPVKWETRRAVVRDGVRQDLYQEAELVRYEAPVQ